MKKMVFSLLLLGIFVAAVGCASAPEEEQVVETPEPLVIEIEPEEEPVEVEVVEELLNENLLTGLPTLTDEAVGKRPMAVMISNVQASMPQYGIGAADLIFEIPAEGGATRLMALYGDYTQVPLIAPVRSARLYFTSFAAGYDAFYAHWGNMGEIEAGVSGNLGSGRFNGAVNTGGLFGRDQGRLAAGYPMEHASTFDGPGLVDAVANLGLRADLEGNIAPAFLFHPLGEIIAPSDESAFRVVVDFNGTTATLVYDEESQIYLKSFNGNPHIDGITNEQLSFTNVLVLETPISVNSIGHNEMNVDGGEASTGYYISGGAVQRITWRRDSGNQLGELRFFDADNGEEIYVNRGRTYIAVNRGGSTSFE